MRRGDECRASGAVGAPARRPSAGAEGGGGSAGRGAGSPTLTPPPALAAIRVPAGATSARVRPSSPSRPGPVRAVALAACCLVSAAALGGCGSSSGAAVLGSKLQQDCTSVADVLSDGPDPDADSLGYAQAQILPLEHLKVSEPALRVAVKNLAAAFQAYSSSTGSAPDEAAARTTRAEQAVNAICPGAAP